MESNDLYAVSLFRRVIGLLCIAGIVVSAVLIVMVGRAEDAFGQPVIPFGAHIEYAGDGAGETWTMAMIDGKMAIVTEEQITVSRQLRSAATAAIAAILCLALSVELCFIPSLSWKLQTLFVRIWSYADPEPGDGWFVWLHIRIVLLTALGIAALIWGFGRLA